MTTTLRGKVRAEIGWTWRDHVDTAPIIDSNLTRFTLELQDGVGDNQADAVWHAEGQSLAQDQATTVDLDMLDQDLFGDVITIPLDKVKAILIVNKNTTGDGYLLVGGAPLDEWSEPFGASGHKVKVMPGSPLLLANVRDGWDVASGQGALRLQALDGSVSYDVAVLGTLLAGASSSSS